MTKAPAFEMPQSVTLYARMGVEAARRYSGIGGGYRLYLLGKALDVSGLGMVKRDVLRAYAFSLGINRRTFERWITQARNYNLFIDVQAASGEWMIRLVSAGKAGAALNVEDVGRKVIMQASELVGPGWKARLWGAYLATFSGKPISRERMQKLANVPVSTQRYRDVQAKVKRIANYSKTTIPGDRLAGVHEFGKRGAFIDADGFIYWRLANSYNVDFALLVGKGRSRKADKELRTHTDGLSNGRQALGQVVRLYNPNPKATKTTLRKIAKLDRRYTVYEYSHHSHNKAVIWRLI